MALYHPYSPLHIFFRRLLALTLGVLLFPLMLRRRQRTRCYSYLHRYWSKTSEKPVWLSQAESTGAYYY
ncbi:hypothetical protein BL250_02620 [Erwinia sp. OLTSP20]|uniref:DUF2517 family protein n=1 Tax=unclassified Erwinia TaxID=2622719 RepID=UPI000C186E7F|nr:MULTISPECIES: DUF2517 family protein [unclassified Erwinia]PIJ48771.1 hypothetical protein BV501_15920 [Erwinia sp. OAMSP11]PIJ69395.1 hypothetical protein BK416_14865 [Erwinia sp. OLSSP12]PIJ79229.1 hypothetical protein BLD47_15170 [Erwinia sp. OLCASP19]PIJ80755.1 hypothetical protein BLD46_14330 [Erwinia sp. OLMTSP26]PIJ82906.1 hypothetical protein BLD49_14225 [Erwinia sp. OLMDSP33]